MKKKYSKAVLRIEDNRLNNKNKVRAYEEEKGRNLTLS